MTDPARFNPLAANITYMPEDYRSSRVQSWYLSVQRELRERLVVDVAYVANRADGLLLFANYNQAAPNNAAGTIPLQQRRPIPEFADITYSFNGGKSRYQSIQGKLDWRLASSLTLMSSLTLSQTKDNGAGSLEEPERQLPGAAGLPQPGRRFRPLRLSPAVQQHDLVRVGSADRSRPPSAVGCAAGRGRGAGRLEPGGREHHRRPGERDTLIYSPAAAFQVSGIQQDFRGANNYRPNVTGEVLVPEGSRTPQNYLSRDTVVLPTDPSQPFGNAERNTVSAPLYLGAGPAGHQARADAVAAGRGGVPHRGIQPAEPLELSALPSTNRSANNFGTITATYDPRILQLGVKVLF